MKRVLCVVVCLCAVAEAWDLVETLDDIPVTRGLRIRRSAGEEVARSVSAEGLVDTLQRVVRTYEVPEVLRGAGEVLQSTPRFAFGKNSFLTGFGLGFLAFGLKKLLLPLFIGAQIVKSVLLALFLPSIIGGIAKLAGKGLTTVAQGSSSSAQGAGAADTITDFDFKDQGGGGGYDSLGAGSDDTNPGVWTYPPDNTFLQTASRQPFPAYTASGVGASSSALVKNQQNLDRFQKFNYDTTGMGMGVGMGSGSKHHGSFYSHDKRQDFKIFHNIPTSSQLLANYDPFYSPLLSRLDSVFQQLGQREESCRERLVCDMYNNPAKFAPFSNLVSAQLSRELNELRKPSSDNPEILRFFRYMKAAKDGQDGQMCGMVYGNCDPSVVDGRPPMVTTFNDINKLVLARKLDISDPAVAEELSRISEKEGPSRSESNLETGSALSMEEIKDAQNSPPKENLKENSETSLKKDSEKEITRNSGSSNIDITRNLKVLNLDSSRGA